MKLKINMIGGAFQHTDCSSAFNKNQHVEWTKDGSANMSFHIDEQILSPINKNKKNYAWISEGADIIPNLYNTIVNNIDYCKSNFINLFTHDRRLIELDPLFFKFVIPNSRPWIQNKKIYKKTKFISFIASNKVLCRGHVYRQKMIEKYQNKVDHYGRGFNTKELPFSIIENNIEESGKLLGLKDYMFSIAMSNSDYDDVFCEKITDCFATGVVPIFWGSKNIINYFDKDGIIFLEDDLNLDILNEEFYNSKIESIKNNFELVYNFQTSEDYIFSNYLK
jgi:hypothetical protein